MVNRAFGMGQPGIGGDEFVNDLLNVFAAKTAEVMRNGEIAHQVVSHSRRDQKG